MTPTQTFASLCSIYPHSLYLLPRPVLCLATCAFLPPFHFLLLPFTILHAFHTFLLHVHCGLEHVLPPFCVHIPPMCCTNFFVPACLLFLFTLTLLPPFYGSNSPLHLARVNHALKLLVLVCAQHQPFFKLSHFILAIPLGSLYLRLHCAFLARAHSIAERRGTAATSACARCRACAAAAAAGAWRLPPRLLGAGGLLRPYSCQPSTVALA